MPPLYDDAFHVSLHVLVVTSLTTRGPIGGAGRSATLDSVTVRHTSCCSALSSSTTLRLRLIWDFPAELSAVIVNTPLSSFVKFFIPILVIPSDSSCRIWMCCEDCRGLSLRDQLILGFGCPMTFNG